MNLLLVEPDEIVNDTVALADRRAVHIRTVIGADPAKTLQAGVVNGPTGTATILDDDGTTLRLRLALGTDRPAPLPIELLLAVPRPKVLSRTLESAAAFGVSRIALTNAWRVDKSYLDSPRLDPAALAEAVRLGAEQGATTHLPPVTLSRRLMELLDGRWATPQPGTHLLAHPGGASIESIALQGPITLAIGPEGGWIQREVDTFVARGFHAVSIGTPILRVETAVAAALGQLLLLLRRR